MKIFCLSIYNKNYDFSFKVEMVNLNYFAMTLIILFSYLCFFFVNKEIFQNGFSDFFNKKLKYSSKLSDFNIPYFAFFAHDRGFETTEAPLNMRVAMGTAAFLCIAIGVFPAPLYNILPYAVDYHPYDASHVTGQMQLLIFAMLAFVVLIRMRLYPPEIPSVVLNSDWFYRRLAPQIGRPVLRAVMLVWGSFLCQMRGFIEAFWFVIDKLVRSPAAGPTIPGPAALVQLILLLAVLSIGYVAALG